MVLMSDGFSIPLMKMLLDSYEYYDKLVPCPCLSEITFFLIQKTQFKFTKFNYFFLIFIHILNMEYFITNEYKIHNNL